MRFFAKNIANNAENITIMAHSVKTETQGQILTAEFWGDECLVNFSGTKS